MIRPALAESLPDTRFDPGLDRGDFPYLLSSPTSRDESMWMKCVRDLQKWCEDSSGLEDDGMAPPALEVLERAIKLAQSMRAEGMPAPQSLVSDPNGGVVFERREGEYSEVFHVWDDGLVEYFSFRGPNLLERRVV